MKTKLLISILLGFFLFVGKTNLSAQVTDRIEVNIPFDFYVRDQHLPAGDYEIRRVGSQLFAREIIHRDGDGAAVFLSYPTEMKTVPTQSELVFKVYGTEKFLTDIFEAGEQEGLELYKTRQEKKLEKMDEETTTVVVPFDHTSS